MNYIIENEPSMTGIVKEVSDTFIMVEGKTELDEQAYLYKVSLEVENKDSMTHFLLATKLAFIITERLRKAIPHRSIPYMRLPCRHPLTEKSIISHNTEFLHQLSQSQTHRRRAK